MLINVKQFSICFETVTLPSLSYKQIIIKNIALYFFKTLKIHTLNATGEV